MPDHDYDQLLRRAIQVSADARAHGNHPFGAILVAPDGSIALEAENTVVTENDVTDHAETNLVRKASRTIPHDRLGDYTLVTSCEPCTPTLDHPCRLVLAAGGRPIDVIGPLLEQEAAVPHTGFWGE